MQLFKKMTAQMVIKKIFLLILLFDCINANYLIVYKNDCINGYKKMF